MSRSRSTIGGRVAAGIAVAVLGAGALTACSSSDSGGSDASKKPTIVASTNVYGSIAEAVAGDKAEVESVITDPYADPHSFEATPADAAKITKADLVVFNGGGYDEFVEKALENAKSIPTISAVDVFAATTGTTVAGHSHDHGDDAHDHGAEAHDHGAEGHDHGTETPAADEHGTHEHGADEHAADAHDHAAEAPGTTSNEHVWYSLPTASALAQKIADELSTIDKANSDTYKKNADAFAKEVDGVNKKFVDAGSGSGHVHYIQTEPIAAHLIEELDSHDLTPAGFTSAIEDETDPSAADFAAMRDLAGNKKEVRFVAFNSQTETEATKQIRDTATKAGVPVVELTETLPEGKTFVTWMSENVDALIAAIKASK